MPNKNKHINYNQSSKKMSNDIEIANITEKIDQEIQEIKIRNELLRKLYEERKRKYEEEKTKYEEGKTKYEEGKTKYEEGKTTYEELNDRILKLEQQMSNDKNKKIFKKFLMAFQDLNS